MSNPNLDSPCCWLNLCCPPDVAAEALAVELGIDVAAAAVVLKRFRLLPLSMEPAADATTAAAVAAQGRLADMNRYAQRELRQILIDLGYRGSGQTE